MNFRQNNLKNATSPYLQQHEDNPIWWQEWQEDVLDYAKKNKKIIFVSVGYATCHWCHVMAQEAFSDQIITEYLNQHFVSIKVDREQRPDIDQHLMSFLVTTTGQGGWPLNAFLAPDLKPIYALTYAPVAPRFGMPGFLKILQKVKEFFDNYAESLEYFNVPSSELPRSPEAELLIKLKRGFDKNFAGFGMNNKFPAHCTLFFMLHYFTATENRELKQMITQTLDIMLMRGLHDHLQGGFFRYCVDRQWTIPHFEKMLYDQAMLLWTYVLSYKTLKKDEYKKAAEKILQCLRETFEHEGLFYSAHDADTEHQEGATYLWSQNELERVLSEEEYKQFTEVYTITQHGNFEGKNHLVKKENIFLGQIEEKLLEVRKKRKQPEIDKKIITSWNALLAVGLIYAYRYLGDSTLLKKAENIFNGLITKHSCSGKLYHSSFEDKVEKHEFLQDYASMLLLLTYLCEEIAEYTEPMKEFYAKTQAFRKDGRWIESHNEDFIEVYAESFDHPIPSSVSLAELALLRADILSGKEFTNTEFVEPLNFDLLNVAVLMRNGLFHIIATPKKLDWNKLPINSMQVRAKELKDCYKGVCRKELAV